MRTSEHYKADKQPKKALFHILLLLGNIYQKNKKDNTSVN